MFFKAFVAVSLASLVSGSPAQERSEANALSVCHSISSEISSQSGVFYPGSAAYAQDILHWDPSSSENSTCTVEPGTAEDVGKILQILARNQTPFGVKGGGHATNPGFSSTAGVLISMYRFRDVEYDSSSQTVVIGTGLGFSDVYPILEPYGVTVVGARAEGVGVAGFSLGGGYSWKTNEHGLALDTITMYELVKPDGEVVSITQHTDPELFFGLKGGFNNFGIVTRITMRAYPQGLVWGGNVVYTEALIPDVTKAISKFSDTNADPKANILAAYSCQGGQRTASLIFFYDDPNPPTSVFQDFLNIPSILNTNQVRTFSDHVSNTTSFFLSHPRGLFDTVPVISHSLDLLNVVQAETFSAYAALQPKDPSVWVLVTLEPFISSALSHNTTPTAYPPVRDRPYFPLNTYITWTPKELDSYVFDLIKDMVAHIRNAAIQQGQDIMYAPMYPNYAIFDTPVEDMYGDNVDKLRALARRVDPDNVMGLAGGFKF